MLLKCSEESIFSWFDVFVITEYIIWMFVIWKACIDWKKTKKCYNFLQGKNTGDAGEGSHLVYPRNKDRLVSLRDFGLSLRKSSFMSFFVYSSLIKFKY